MSAYSEWSFWLGWSCAVLPIGAVFTAYIYCTSRRKGNGGKLTPTLEALPRRRIMRTSCAGHSGGADRGKP